MTALLDQEGHAATSRFLVVRPHRPGPDIEFYWAIFNSPYANAYVYTHADKRSIGTEIMRLMPMPEPRPSEVERVTAAARAYLELARQKDAGQDNLRTRLLHVDAEVLRLYDLPPRLERTLLRLFAGYRRPGVPFDFDRYYPPEIESAVPLYIFLSEEYRRAKPSRLFALETERTPPGLVDALRRATDDFEE